MTYEAWIPEPNLGKVQVFAITQRMLQKEDEAHETKKNNFYDRHLCSADEFDGNHNRL